MRLERSGSARQQRIALNTRWCEAFRAHLETRCSASVQMIIIITICIFVHPTLMPHNCHFRRERICFGFNLCWSFALIYLRCFEDVLFWVSLFDILEVCCCCCFWWDCLFISWKFFCFCFGLGGDEVPGEGGGGNCLLKCLRSTFGEIVHRNLYTA